MRKHIGEVLPRHKKTPNKRFAIAGGIFLIGLMVLSSLAFILDNYSQPDNTVTYENYTFLPVNSGWKTTLQEKDVIFNYLPDSVESVEVGSAPQIIQTSRVLWITYDPHAEYADVMGGIQYADDHLLYDLKGIYVQRGLVNNSAFPELPEIGCNNATASEPVLLLTQTNDTNKVGLRTEGTCITITGQFGDDFQRYNERILYTLLGVITR